MSCINEAYKNVQSATTISSCDTQPLQDTLFELANETNEALCATLSCANGILDRLGAQHHTEYEEFPFDSYRDKAECIKELANRLNTAVCQIAVEIG